MNNTERNNLTPVRCGCGGEAEVKKHTFYRALPLYSVKCDRCGIQVPSRNTEAEAITAWNLAMTGSCEKCNNHERTAKVVEDEWTEHKMLSRDYGKIYYQHDCSCNLYESPYPFCPNCGMKMKRGDR